MIATPTMLNELHRQTRPVALRVFNTLALAITGAPLARDRPGSASRESPA